MSLYPQYAKPHSTDQATELLSTLSTGAVIIAGGQEIMPSVNYGHLMPSVYVDISSLSDLEGIKYENSEVSIGALTVHRDIQNSDVVNKHLPLLSYAAQKVGGGWQVHNRGTIGGNIVAMHPLYDIIPSLLILDAELEIISSKGKSRVSVANMLKDTSHGLGSKSILSKIFIKPMDIEDGWAYEKLKITSGGYGSANSASIVKTNNSKITKLRVAVGAVSPLPVDVSEILSSLIGNEWNDTLTDVISSKCSSIFKDALSDQQGDDQWRKSMAGVMAIRSIKAALKK
jgi:carbon-monoxide dehydrogenase medium subunit/2-furoyl-CoA dehydrogenase FAD binding subunit